MIGFYFGADPEDAINRGRQTRSFTDRWLLDLIMSVCRSQSRQMPPTLAGNGHYQSRTLLSASQEFAIKCLTTTKCLFLQRAQYFDLFCFLRVYISLQVVQISRTTCKFHSIIQFNYIYITYYYNNSCLNGRHACNCGTWNRS